ncbi:YjgB family protein [Cohnella sp. WQ 127256]|uniref:YjgB family protein n=1 Tax=Cohnella sp. WQ 127256 TaxID=2938790 RepID=UPI0021191D73|nr:YjgB family protein [Cohnella sp. WQ 127256]
MNNQIKMITLSAMLVGMLTLTACNSNNQSSPSQSVVPSETPITSPSASPLASPSSSPKTSPSASPENVKPSQEPSATAEASATSKQIKEILELAKDGKAPGIEYAAHTGLIDEVEKAWGEADTQDAAGKGIYATYVKKNAVFGFNKGSLIFDVRSSDAKLQKLTLKQIQQTLGKPDETKVNGEDTIYIYQANKQFQLKFIISKSTGKVDHISVFSAQDSINSMAN